ELFIYSDAPKNENAVEKVNEVREYIKTINGFKKVTIIERDKNWGLANSIIDGLVLVGENGYGDEFGTGSDEAFSVLEVAQLYGGEIQILPERRGNRMTAEVVTAKTQSLGWSAKRKLAEYIRV
ncbi:MAG: hypothetical protein IE881_09095, partial [Epsilonproteobacteria bacterium]|nr:hypothetical protein [Campylobacterota bacterium]